MISSHSATRSFDHKPHEQADQRKIFHYTI